MLGSDVINSSKYNNTATNNLFNFSSDFSKILGLTIELGRSFVQPEYQPSSETEKPYFLLITYGTD